MSALALLAVGLGAEVGGSDRASRASRRSSRRRDRRRDRPAATPRRCRPAAEVVSRPRSADIPSARPPAPCTAASCSPRSYGAAVDRRRRHARKDDDGGDDRLLPPGARPRPDVRPRYRGAAARRQRRARGRVARHRGGRVRPVDRGACAADRRADERRSRPPRDVRLARRGRAAVRSVARAGGRGRARRRARAGRRRARRSRRAQPTQRGRRARRARARRRPARRGAAGARGVSRCRSPLRAPRRGRGCGVVSDYGHHPRRSR